MSGAAAARAILSPTSLHPPPPWPATCMHARAGDPRFWCAPSRSTRLLCVPRGTAAANSTAHGVLLPSLVPPSPPPAPGAPLPPLPLSTRTIPPSPPSASPSVVVPVNDPLCSFPNQPHPVTRKLATLGGPSGECRLAALLRSPRAHCPPPPPGPQPSGLLGCQLAGHAPPCLDPHRGESNGKEGEAGAGTHTTPARHLPALAGADLSSLFS